MARLSPRPDVPTSVRRLPAPTLQAIAPAEPTGSPSSPALDPAASDPPAAPPRAVAAAEPSPAPRTAVMALSPDRYKLTLTIGGDTIEKLRLAKDMLGHAIPSGDDAAVLDRALTALLSDLARKKFADTRKPRPARGNKTRTRNTPAAVKRAVSGPGSRSLRLHRSERPSLPRAPVRRVPSPGSLRSRRRGECRSDRAAMPASQRLRRTVVLRKAPPGRDGRRGRYGNRA
jgi:hypothetical protein